MNRIVGGLAAASLCALTACGSHPGTAAVIGDKKVSMGEFEDVAADFCEIAAASEQPVAGSDARSQALQTLVQLHTARDAASELGVDVSPSAYTLSNRQLEGYLGQYPDVDPAVLERLLELIGETSATVGAIGAEQLDVEPSSQEALAAGQEYLVEHLQELDIEVDPSFGFDAEGAVVSSGLSVSIDEANLPPVEEGQPPASAIEPAELPESQRCG